MFVAGKKRKYGSTSRSGSSNLHDLSMSNAPITTQINEPTPAEEIQRLFKLAVENIREQQYHTALRYLHRAIATGMSAKIRNSKLYESRAHVLYKLGQYKHALSDAKEAIVINGNSAMGYAHMANVLIATGKLEDALAVTNRGLSEVLDTTDGYRYLYTISESVKKRLDPSYNPVCDLRSDPLHRLPLELGIMVLRYFTIPELIVCRGICKHWKSLIDSTPILWAYPEYTSGMLSGSSVDVFPSYKKTQRQARRSQSRVPDKIVRSVFEKSRGSLTRVNIPDGALITSKTIDVLFSRARPRLHSVYVSRVTESSSVPINRILQRIVPSIITKIQLPYCPSVNNTVIRAIAVHIPQLRVLDISGCTNLSIKQFYKAWCSTLTDFNDSACIEELFLNDHPGIPYFLVYSVRYSRCFSRLRKLHIGISDPVILPMVRGLGVLVNYFLNLTNIAEPFPHLEEANLNGLWDPAKAAGTFESSLISLIVSRCKLLPRDAHTFSAINSPVVTSDHLFMVLQHCFGSLKTLHLTGSQNFDGSLVNTLLDIHSGQLILVSLDVSGCVGASPECLARIVRMSPNLTYANFTQTPANNTTLASLTELITTPNSAGIRILILDTTDVTGSGVRDFVRACAKRFVGTRGNRRSIGHEFPRRRWRLELLDIDNCVNIAPDAVSVIIDNLSFMSTRISVASST